jgi:hypothetical protein
MVGKSEAAFGCYSDEWLRGLHKRVLNLYNFILINRKKWEASPVGERKFFIEEGVNQFVTGIGHLIEGVEGVADPKFRAAMDGVTIESLIEASEG